MAVLDTVVMVTVLVLPILVPVLVAVLAGEPRGAVLKAVLESVLESVLMSVLMSTLVPVLDTVLVPVLCSVMVPVLKPILSTLKSILMMRTILALIHTQIHHVLCGLSMHRRFMVGDLMISSVEMRIFSVARNEGRQLVLWRVGRVWRITAVHSCGTALDIYHVLGRCTLFWKVDQECWWKEKVGVDKLIQKVVLKSGFKKVEFCVCGFFFNFVFSIFSNFKIFKQAFQLRNFDYIFFCIWTMK